MMEQQFTWRGDARPAFCTFAPVYLQFEHTARWYGHGNAWNGDPENGKWLATQDEAFHHLALAAPDLEQQNREPVNINIRTMGKRKKPKQASRLLPAHAHSEESALSLAQKEESSMLLLRATGIDAEELKLATALSLHVSSADKKFKLALRVVLAQNAFPDNLAADIGNQLDVFCMDLVASIESMDCPANVAENLRAAFLKAALHRVEPGHHERCQASPNNF